MNDVKVYLLKRPRTLPSGKRVHYWTLRWSDSSGKQQNEAIKTDAGRAGRCDRMTRREADAIRRAKIVSIGSGRSSRDRPRAMTLPAFFEYDRQAIRTTVKAATIVEHETAGKHATKALGEHVKMASVTRADVGRIAQRLEDLGRSRATIAKTVRTLRAMFNRALAEGLIVRNPFADQRLGKVQSKRKRIFAPEEVAAMVEAAPDQWWRTFLLLGVTSGLRRGELLNLQWQDVDLEAGTVTLTAKRAGTFEAGGAVYPILEWETKSYHERTVPVPSETVEALRRMELRAGGSPYVFLTLDRLARLSFRLVNGRVPPNVNLVNNLLRDFRLIQQDARKRLAKARSVEVGKVEWAAGTVHDLRKTFGTRAASNGVPMHELQRWLGHAKITTTAVYYVEVEAAAEDRLRKAITVAA